MRCSRNVTDAVAPVESSTDTHRRD